MCFNSAVCKRAPVLRIENGNRYGQPQTFVTSGLKASPEINAFLLSHAEKLSHTIGCWPSSGITCISLLVQEKVQIIVQNMDLLPKLTQMDSARPNTPATTCFHNWLGERRYALTKLSSHLNWSELILPPPQEERTNSISSPWQFLKKLRTEPKNIVGLKELSECSTSSWLSGASIETLLHIEDMFFLNRNQKISQNWWLFSPQASRLLSTIHYQVAWVQQFLLTKEVSQELRIST